MKEIGETLKSARESMGISIEEAAEDLKMRPSQIENIEEGNMEAFKDIFYLKYFIRDYAKYLGLDYEELIDEFNEFLFDYTSKISLEDIKKAREKNKSKEKTKKIISPYTLETRKRINIPPYVIYILIGLFIVLIIYFIISLTDNDDFKEEGIVISNIIE